MNLTPKTLLSEEKPKYIFLLEDNHDLRTDLAKSLEFCGFTVFQYADAQAFLDNFSHLVPAVVLTDMRMPGLSGVELQERLAAEGRKIPMIFISGESTDAQIVSALKNGAVDFLLKPFSRESLLSAVAKGIEIDALAMQRLVKKVAFEQKMKILSPRELETFGLLVIGFNNIQIANELGISLPTAKQYKSAVLYKLGLRSIAELVSLKLNSE
jgi:FixJ family two-component response regulator